MENYKTFENALELFRTKEWIGNYNCIFLANKDLSNNSNLWGFLGGGLGGAIGALSESSKQGAAWGKIGLENCNTVLINQTEYGIGLIPMKQKKIGMSNMELDTNRFASIKNEQLQSIVVKKFSVLNKNTKKIIITLKDGTIIRLVAKINEKTLPYQQQNFKKFIDRYEQ